MLLEIHPVLIPVRRTIPLTLITLALAAGCQSSDPGSAGGRLSPADFDASPESDSDAPRTAEAESPPAAERYAERTVPEPSDGADPSATSDDPAASDSENPGPSTEAADATNTGDPANARSGDRLVFDAMVGQVNGKPIYAGQIFKTIGTEQLERLGESQSRLAFRRRAQQLIVSDLRSRVTNALLLRQAERDLSEQERRGLDAMMRKEREKILSEYGGVRALAEAGLREKTGRTIEEELEARRKSMLVERYMHQKFRPRVHVSRREVERYYRDHYNEFNPTPTVTVRLIIAREANTAERVREALSDGEPFKEVARQYSDIRARRGGLMPPFQLDSSFDEFDSLRWPELNKAVRRLEPGEHSDRIDLDLGAAWVKLEELEGGERKSLQDVFLKIERRLRAQKMDRLQRRHIEKLMEDGNFTPIDQMASALLEVAMARYARPPQ